MLWNLNTFAYVCVHGRGLCCVTCASSGLACVGAVILCTYSLGWGKELCAFCTIDRGRQCVHFTVMYGMRSPVKANIAKFMEGHAERMVLRPIKDK